MKVLAGVLLLAGAPAQALFEERPFSARGAALGGAMVAALGDPAGAYYNPATLAFAEKPTLTTGYSRFFAMDDLGYGSLAANLPTRRGTWALMASDFGSDFYREREAGAAAGFRLSPAAAFGFAVKGQSLDVERYGTAASVQGDAGIVFRPLPFLDAGAAVRNLTRSRVGKTGEPPPGVFSVGASAAVWKYGPTLLSLRQESGGVSSWRFGQELRPHRAFAFRAGFETKPNRFSFGLGAARSFLALDYAMLTHPQLADQHHFSVTVHWR